MAGVLNECVLPHHREVGRTTVRVLVHKSRNRLLLQQDRPVELLAALVLIDAEAKSLGHCKQGGQVHALVRFNQGKDSRTSFEKTTLVGASDVL